MAQKEVKRNQGFYKYNKIYQTPNNEEEQPKRGVFGSESFFIFRISKNTINQSIFLPRLKNSKKTTEMPFVIGTLNFASFRKTSA